MAEDTRTIDPRADARAEYDYTGGSVAQPAVASALEERVAGDVRFDAYSRQLYATDASAYEEIPIGVVCPESAADVVAVMEYCASEGIPVLPRGGGTSLAGQAVNEAVVLDFTRHMDGIRSVDPEDGTVTAQPGVTLAALNDELAPHGLKFAPDPAWGDKSVLGGAIGNNSTGAHSLQYGKTDAYIESCAVVLADGTETTLGWVDVESLHDRATAAREAGNELEARLYAEVGRIVHEEADEIRERYPQLKRTVSGYNLDRLIQDAEAHGAVNMARLLAGSEGTLAIVTEATVALEPVPAESSVVLLTYDGVQAALRDVAPILEHDPAALEVMDDVFLELAREAPKFGDLVEALPDGTEATLLVEFYAEDPSAAKQRVADLLADRLPDYSAVGDPTADRVTTTADIHAVDALEAYDDARQSRFWDMRKAGLPILLSRTDDEKHWPFVEDTAVPPECLPEYVADLEAIFEEHDTFATYYAHAGPGVLHVRPLVNLKTETGVETMRSIAESVTDLVVEYGGSVSGEHGDGRARTRFNRKLFGESLWATFRELKTAADPEWLLNPGSVCGDVEPDEGLRYGPDYAFDAGFEPELNWATANGFQGMVELCHGCGGCRGAQDTTGGVMCPTYRASEEEVTSTRGRANALRAAMDGDLPADPFGTEFAEEVLDLCIGCKGCKNDCPSGVDMAKLKAEVGHERHQREGISLRDRLFGNVERVLALGSALAPVSNLVQRLPGAGWLAEQMLGIARERTLPTFHRETFTDWWEARGGARVAADAAERRALLTADPYTEYTAPAVGRAAVRVLEAADVHVAVPESVSDSGRPAFSKSLLERSRQTAKANVTALAPRIEQGWDVVCVEPSDAVMYQSDYLDLLSGDRVERVAPNTYGVCEYLDVTGLADELGAEGTGHLAYHGHCHQKAHRKDHHAVGVLRRAGYTVDPLDSTCCGMAGSFGYEAEHYSMSQAIGSILFEQVADSAADRVVAPGASCRAQLGDRDGATGEPPHPIEALANAVE